MHYALAHTAKYVRLWHLADIRLSPRDVRFWGKAGSQLSPKSCGTPNRTEPPMAIPRAAGGRAGLT
jgi:hypothetical protein